MGCSPPYIFLTTTLSPGTMVGICFAIMSAKDGKISLSHIRVKRVFKSGVEKHIHEWIYLR